MNNKFKKLRLFLDLNETLIRTGEVDDKVLVEETNSLIKFRKNCRKINNLLESFELVFLTGNSFEYSRRIEEPLGVKNIENISLVIISENGLLSRSFSKGNLWKLNVTNSYINAISSFEKKISTCGISYYTQGNEIRYTLKPSNNEFTPLEISKISSIAKKCKLNIHAKIYEHKFYIDIDPLYCIENGTIYTFKGKYEAVSRITQLDNSYFNIAIGDSKSDIPMFKAVLDNNGESYWVSNTLSAQEYSEAKILEKSFTDGVNEILENYIKRV